MRNALTAGSLWHAREGAAMTKSEVYAEPSEVQAVEGNVEVDGPDSVDVAMTPEAAEETSERLLGQAMKARGQRRMKNNVHKPKDG